MKKIVFGVFPDANNQNRQFSKKFFNTYNNDDDIYAIDPKDIPSRLEEVNYKIDDLWFGVSKSGYGSGFSRDQKKSIIKVLKSNNTKLLGKIFFEDMRAD